MNLNEIELTVWKHPEAYFGFSPEGDYLAAATYRDADALQRSNFRSIQKSLEEVLEKLYKQGKEEAIVPDRESGEMPWVYTFTARCSLFGWREYLMVRWDAPEEILDELREIEAGLEDYPVVDEEDFSNEEYEEAQETWEFYGLRDRIELCVEAGLSMFAARSDSYPCDDQGYIQERLLGH